MSKVSLINYDCSNLRVPFYSGHISAGFPGVVDEHMEDTLSLDQLLIQHPATTFFARVEGDSMIGAGVFENDILVVDRALEAKNNDIVVALLDNEFTVKRLINKSSPPILKAENPDYPNIVIHDSNELIIWGVVTGLARSFR
jgi:DNA polymerase V